MRIALRGHRWIPHRRARTSRRRRRRRAGTRWHSRRWRSRGPLRGPRRIARRDTTLDGLPSHLGNDGLIGLADCAVITNPTSSQLANIAIATASTMELLVPGYSPRVALLSFSTHGSSVHSSVDEITRAVALIREKSSLLVDGELQVDAALIPAVAEVKAPESALHGRANILIFPDLNSANIGYKLMQYAGGARSYGPIFQGLRYPMNDLSRGATPEEIVGVIACSCLQSQS